MVNYLITPNIKDNTFEVELSFVPHGTTHNLKLPTWIPGSYMIREFSKNIIHISAIQVLPKANKSTPKTTNVTIHQINKNSWELSKLKPGGEVKITYSVYSFDDGIRASYLDNQRGYFNNTSVCLYVVGYENLEHQIIINSLPKKWQVATALMQKKIKSKTVYVADNYDTLIDSPFELSEWTKLSFNASGVLHDVILSGYIHPKFDSNRLLSDMKKICTTEFKMFGTPMPFKKYTFLLNLSGNIYTGLEHKYSTSLMAPYYSLPVKGENVNSCSKNYQKLLGLISHEYFHVWNVKRIKPKAFDPYDLDTENYTELLWWFEGITSYYDDLILYRAGVISRKEYLQCVIDNINYIYKNSGVLHQTIAESSFTAWTKYYKQDENSINITVSYYVLGALIALSLDLLIRQRHKSKSLDDVLRLMYKKFQQGISIGETDIPQIIQDATGCDLKKELNSFLYSCKTLPLKRLLANFGVKLHQLQRSNYSTAGKVIAGKSELSDTGSIDLKAKLVKVDGGYQIKQIYTDSVLKDAGLVVNDVLIAIDNVKLSDIDMQLNLYKSGDQVDITFFRKEKLYTSKLKLIQGISKTYFLEVVSPKLLDKWL